MKITDSYGPVFMTKYEETQSIRLILQGLKQCWKVIVTTLFLACLAGIALWIAVRRYSCYKIINLPRVYTE